jgi:hypothetical protein
MRFSNPLIAVILGGAAITLCAQEPTESSATSSLSGALSTGYESLHIYRGVDSALGDDILWTSAAVTVADATTLGVWYGTGPNSDYEEIDLFGSHVFAVNDLQISVGFLWYTFPENSAANSTDFILKFSQSFAIGDAGSITPYLSLVYNESAQGFYEELGATARFPMSDLVAFEVTGWIALSQDFRPETGLDNATLLLALPIAVTDTVSLRPAVGASLAFDAIKSISQDETWASLSLNVSF